MSGKNEHLVKFSGTQDDLLIEYVQENKVIFDNSDQKHKDALYKEQIWNRISEKVNRSADDCKRRWKNIRDSHIRQKKKLSTRSAAPDRKTPVSKFQLSFLDSVEYEKKPISNIEEVVKDSDNDSSVEEEELPTAQEDLPSTSYGGKRTRSNADKLPVVLAKRGKDRNDILSLPNNLQGDDDVDLFFKSVAFTVKKFPLQTIRDTKIKILAYVSQLENQNLGTQRQLENHHSQLESNISYDQTRIGQNAQNSFTTFNYNQD